MQIILASAKIMHDNLESQPNICMSTPRFENEAIGFVRDIAQYDAETIAAMLACSHQIAAQNKLRYMQYFEEKPKMPAILAYQGQAYKHLKAEMLTTDDLHDAQRKLWITSFLYGLLRPLDGILPYRMEGNIELPSGEGKNMFGFWKSRLQDGVGAVAQTNLLCNLGSVDGVNGLLFSAK